MICPQILKFPVAWSQDLSCTSNHSLTSIMNYALCIAHDLTTMNRHDHAWTETWAQTSVRCASRYLSGDHDMLINKVIGAVTPARWKVSEQIIQLALPNWMWVLWSSWEGRAGRSYYGYVVPYPRTSMSRHFKHCTCQNWKNYFGESSFYHVVLRTMLRNRACEAVW